MRHQAKATVGISLLLAIGMLLVSACGQQPAEPAAVPAPTEAATEADPPPAAEATAEDAPADEEMMDEAPTDAPTEAPEEPEETPTTAPDEDEDDSADRSGTDDEEDGSSPAITAGEGLEALDSYRMEFVFSFAGTENESQNGTMEMLMEMDNTTNNMHAKLTMSGPGMENAVMGMSSLEAFQIDETVYMIADIPGFEEDQCSSTTATEDPTFFNPEDMIGEMEDATLVEEGVEVNGIMTDHYTIEEGNQVFSEMQEIENATADMWVAQDGGYLVKLEAEATGEDIMPGMMNDTIEGTFTMTYELSEVNSLDAIELPEACENATEMTLPSGEELMTEPDETPEP